MNLINDIFNYFSLDYNKPYSFWFQIFCIAPLIWFGRRSYIILKKELQTEHVQQGAVPVMAMVYMIFSILFIIKFIGNFDEINSLNERVLRTHFDNFRNLNVNKYIYSVNILSSLALTAFTFNFCKSFFTLNSLEFGKFNDDSLKSFFFGKLGRVKAEAIIRLVIAYLFISLEHLFSEDIVDKNMDPEKYLIEISHYGFFLYPFLLFWLICLFIWNKKNKSTISFKQIILYIFTAAQFLCGIGIIFWFDFFGDTITDSSEYLEKLLSWKYVGFFCAIVIILTIFVNEILSYINPEKNNATL